MARYSDPYADLLTGAKIEHLLEEICRPVAGEYASAREISEELVKRSTLCEFLVSKGQARITFDLRPDPATPAEPAD